MVLRRSFRAAALAISVAVLGSGASAQTGPDLPTRERALAALVQIRATSCSDGTERAGTGFAYRASGQIVTAHHVVGGCRAIRATYEQVAGGGQKTFSATIRRVLAAGDLALLEVAGPPNVAPLDHAPAPADRNAHYAGFGYQNGQPTAGDQLVTFSTGSSRLKDILPDNAVSELRRNGSAIDVESAVLRFNVALQPGMSGGPIIDRQGRVVGIVAGGLKAGAATASWGWPAEWIERLMASADTVGQEVRIASSYYTLSDMEKTKTALQSGRSVTCGGLKLDFQGTRRFSELAASADDQERLNYILQITTLPPAELDKFTFDIWVHRASGATAVTPAGYSIRKVGDVCMVASNVGPFRQVVWGARAGNWPEVQNASMFFEQSIMQPLVPYNFGFNIDYVLSLQQPQFRANGFVFYRKAFSILKSQWMQGMPPPPMAHAFETLIAKSGSFLGVGTVNDDLSPHVQYCLQTRGQDRNCLPVLTHFAEWTYFVLATQLSTYPAT